VKRYDNPRDSTQPNNVTEHRVDIVEQLAAGKADYRWLRASPELP
jgi:hypothetical protein